MPNHIRIATRNSPLALKQAELIKQQLIKQDGTSTIEFIEIISDGDKNTTDPLTEIGGKALFVKALQQALLEDKADIAVHCIKDMSVTDIDGLCLAAICQREDARDVFISNRYNSLSETPEGSIIGTSSPRRRCLLLQHYPMLEQENCRGNVNSRLKKLDEDLYDGLILAAAGLKRLGLEDKITEYLPIDMFLPAIGQGCLGIECRSGDTDIIERLQCLNHDESQQCIIAEREVNRVLGGDCHSAIAAYATLTENSLTLMAAAGDINNGRIIETHVKGDAIDAVEIGQCAAENLLTAGAKKLLA
jgi:hydroxymethylbilane synthase